MRASGVIVCLVGLGVGLGLGLTGCKRGGAERRGLALPEVEGVPVRIDRVRAETSYTALSGMDGVSFPERKERPPNQVRVTYRVTAREDVADDRALEARTVCRWGEHVVASPFVEALQVGSRRVGVGALGKGASAEGFASTSGFPPFAEVPEVCEVELRYGARLPQGATAPATDAVAVGTICWLRGEVSAGRCKDALRPGVGGGGAAAGAVAHFEGMADERGALFWFLVRRESASSDVVTTRTTCRAGTTFSQKTESSHPRVRLADLRDGEVAVVSGSARAAREQTEENAACEVGVFVHLRDDEPGAASAATTYCIEGAKAAPGPCTL